MDNKQEKRLNRIEEKLDKVIGSLEKAKFAEYIEYAGNRRRILRNSLLIGMARGLGTAVGLTVLGALLLYLLQWLAKNNLPIIGNFIAELVRIVDERL